MKESRFAQDPNHWNVYISVNCQHVEGCTPSRYAVSRAPLTLSGNPASYAQEGGDGD